MSIAAPEFNISRIHSESKRIIIANSRHFLALSILFLLSVSISLFIYPILQLQSSTPPINPLKIETIALPLIYSLFAFIQSLRAVGTITYTTYHGFYGKPVKLASSLKSYSDRYIHLAATTIMVLIPLALALFLGLVVSRSIHYHHDDQYYYRNNSSYYYFIGLTLLFRAVVLIICILVVVYVQVNWSLASVIVVVKSKWGFEALRQSKYLLRGAAGMRWVSLSMMFMYGYTIGIFVLPSLVSYSLMNMGGSFSYWWMIIWVLQIATGSVSLAMFMHTYIVAFTVLYMYCKFMRGDLDWGINAKESATEYVSLPFNDHVVEVAQA